MSHGIKQLMCKLDKADELSKLVNCRGLFSAMGFGTCPALGFDWDFLRSVIHRQGT